MCIQKLNSWFMRTDIEYRHIQISGGITNQAAVPETHDVCADAEKSRKRCCVGSTQRIRENLVSVLWERTYVIL